MKTKEAKNLAKKPVRKRAGKKPVAKKVAKPKVEVRDPLTNIEKVQVVLVVSILAAMFYFGT